MKDPNTIHSTTQQFLDIYDITNDILILKDGSASLILQVNAVNFGLLAEAEQDAIIYSYAGLLNSLNFPVQIVIHSETKDVSHYLQSLQQQEEETPSETRKQQIRKYRTFVSDLIRERNVLDKKFYFVIPASALELGLVSAKSVVPGVKTAQAVELDRSLILDRALTNLYPKRDHLIGQFARIGLYARQLVTQEIIHLFYNFYNPESAEGQSISNTQNYTTAVVEAKQGDTMTDMTQNQTPTASNPVAAPSPISAAPTTQATMPVSSAIPTTGTPSVTAPVPGLPPLPNLPTPANPVAPTVDDLLKPSTPAAPMAPVAAPTTPETPAVSPLTPPASDMSSSAPVTPTVPTITPAEPSGIKPVMPAPVAPSMPAAPAAPTAPAQPQPAAQSMSSTSAGNVDSEQDAQSLIDNTLQQIDPSTLTTPTSPVPAPDQSKSV